MTYTVFFIPDYQFQKVFLMFPYVISFYCFCGGPLVVEALGNCPVCPLLNPVLVCLSVRDHIFISSELPVRVFHGRGSALLWRRSDTLRISGLWIS